MAAISGISDNTPGQIYVSQSTPAPVLIAAGTSSGLMLSWVVPSTELVLQQDSELGTTNWTEWPMAPALNLTNLQNQVLISPLSSHGFYRLKTQ